MNHRLILLALALVLIPMPAAALTGPARVIDGDTLAIGDIHFRLYAIDAPETRQHCADAAGADFACGLSAKVALKALIDSQPVECAPCYLDRYGRTVATCSAGGLDLGDAMVSQGWALAYRRYGSDYIAAEGQAKATRRGLWAGTFVPPWNWRATPSP